MTLQGKSNDWVLALAQEKGLPEPVAVLESSYDDTRDWLLAHPEIQDIVIVDDASHSGKQIYGITVNIRRALQDEQLSQRNIRTHVVVPFMTEYATKTLTQYEYNNILVYDHKKLTTIAEILNQLEPAKRDEMLTLLSYAFPNIHNAQEFQTLTYFQHKAQCPRRGAEV